MNKKAILITILFAITLLILTGCMQTKEMRILEDNKMKTVTIDFSNCKYAQDLYEETIKAMEFSDWCGRNLDAIWDMLKGEEEMTVHFKGMEKLSKDLQQEALEIFNVFVDAEQESGDIHPICD